LLADAAPEMDRLLASPAGRARDTAAAVAERRGLVLQLHENLVEMDFGEWEDLTAEEAEALHPEQFAMIYRRGIDVPRGLNGESFADAGARLADAIGAMVEAHPGERIGMVTHGGAARAYVAHVLGLDFATRERLPVLKNTARARVLYRDHGPRLAEYNVAPHLEG
jgi:probable phosphoglycerate mutase